MEAAIREKSIAIGLMKSNDYMKARNKLLDARNTWSGLENINELITVCDIMCTAQFQLPGSGIDWYWILQTTRTVDESVIDYKYTNLIRVLGPIKGKFPGVDSALELIKQAYDVLSDRQKRQEFDLKRTASWGPCGGNVEPLNIAYPKEMEATSQSSSGSKRIVSQCSDKSNIICSAGAQPLKTVRSASEGDGEVVAENQALVNRVVANTCSQEASPDSAFTKAGFNNVAKCLVSSFGIPSSSMVHKEPTLEFYDFANNRKAEVFAIGQIWAAYDQEKMPRNYARINSIEKMHNKETNSTDVTLYVRWLKPAPLNIDEKKWHEAGLPICCGYFMQEKFNIDKCNRMVGGSPVFSHFISSFKDLTNDLFELYPQEGEVWAVYKDWKPFNWCNDPKTRKGCQFQLVEILTGYSKQPGVKVASLVKVAGFTSIFRRQEIQGSDFSYQITAPKSFIFSHNIPAYRFAGEKRGLFPGMVFELDPLSIPEDVVVETVAAKPPLEGRSSDASRTKHPIPISPPISSGPKPKWPEEAFSSGQIWAIYDDGPDAMPRRYVIVHGVNSGGEVSVTYLKPHPKLEDEMKWVEQNLPVACGSFRTGGVTLNLQVSRFSHLMKCDDSSSNSNKYLHKIYPREGEIWAMYKNWNSKWNHSNLINCQYRYVEILSSCSEDVEMRVASLVEVNGRKTFFHRQLYDDRFELTRTVSMKELLSFSHQVPAFTVPGIENHGIPADSWHLEPDALPAIPAN
ncbi:hypothetical protein C5167_022095 [Papaver somniferum]|uniref:J domain-containing protein n=1 Tax=Papaver somniferum TaxID=3469 RepID=A0A4Y7JK50_PAPSO|nr:uncharacterized protein LOC113281177 [Papaver somniferum]RZC60341.1 hypothetical protein C5167_022095 [Papaver somniferum]